MKNLPKYKTTMKYCIPFTGEIFVPKPGIYHFDLPKAKRIAHVTVTLLKRDEK